MNTTSLTELTYRLAKDLDGHIEEFACAFAKLTDLPPDKIIMCHSTEWRDGNLINKIWFEKKKE